MNQDQLTQLLEAVRAGSLGVAEAQERLANEHSGITGPEGDGAQERLKSEGH